MTTAKPRVLIVSHGHPALVAGGTETVAHDLFQELNRSGTAEASFLGCVTALHRPAPPDCSLQSYDGSQNEYLLHVGEYDPFMLAHGITSRSLDDFGRLLDTIRPDVVHFHHLFLIGAESLALVRNRLPSARIVLTLHDFHPICHRDGLMMQTRSDALCGKASPDACHACFNDISPGRFSLRVHHLQNMLGLVDRFVAPSNFLRQRYDDWGISEHVIDCIPNGLPVGVQAQESVNRQIRNRFGFFGNMAPHKGPLVALDALNRIEPDFGVTLTLHGALQFQGDAFRDRFNQAVEKESDRAHYFGPYNRAHIISLMNAVDWVIVPSIWWENAPLTILESFRAGRPVIASNVGGMAELVSHGVNGLLFRRNDPADLAEVMKRAAGEEGLWQRMADNLPAVPTTADIADCHMTLYADLLNQPQQRTG